MGNELVKIDDAQIAKIDQIVSDYNLATLEDIPGHIAKTLKMAEGIELLEQALNPVIMSKIMRLKGTRLGFRTDERGAEKKYDVIIIKRCVIEALFMKLNITGNQFNVIAGNTYVTKEGFTYLIREYKGLTDLIQKIDIDYAAATKFQAIVIYSAAWKLNGQDQSIDERIPVRVNSGMGADAILGKGERKGLARIFRMLTGSAHTNMMDGEIEDMDLIEANATVRDAKSNPLKPGRHENKKPDPEPAKETAEPPADTSVDNKDINEVPSDGKASELQLGIIIQHFKDSGVEDKNERLDFVNSILKENELPTVSAAAEISFPAAGVIIDHITPTEKEQPANDKPPATDGLFN